ncbi:SDR family oxidoreductase [Aureimonas leprariae]|uniref:SDR family NAD(P)-dependent oxidoreductase n=1 Tax=Plantimonas leprariae TaxID=2615207 RepID=A0A7V7TY55_9HYPH|nr:SDR family oxidoreductase [Aureimonas leprariae]KAB0682622.1 SDR family NAD(P)-dependent oxidoreductase [Aureimonas leprariae]
MIPRRNQPASPPRTVVVTGGSSGIGRATALRFARAGWRVGLIARGTAGLEDARREIERSGAPCATAVADVSLDAETERAAAALEAALGPLTVWVNSAGNGVFGRFLDVSDAEFRRVTDVTYGGTVNGTRAALKRMRPRDAGVVINVCSGVAFHGMPLLSSYSGAKYAVRGFADAVRSELLQEASRVRITTVFPPAVNTPYFRHAASHLDLPPRPAKPVYQPEVVAEAIFRAALVPRREVEVSTTTVLFALANKLSPALMDKVIRRLGYDGQTTASHKAALSRDPTLFEPSAKASGARGDFGDEARGFSLQTWADRHRGALAAAGAGAVLAALFVRRR